MESHTINSHHSITHYELQADDQRGAIRRTRQRSHHIEAVDDMLEDLREQHPEKYWKFMRKAHEQLWAATTTQSLPATTSAACTAQMHKAKSRRAHIGLAKKWLRHGQGKHSPKGTTDCDKWVAANAFWHDLRKNFDDAEILQAAFLFFIADEDRKHDGKVWAYMNK